MSQPLGRPRAYYVAEIAVVLDALRATLLYALLVVPFLCHGYLDRLSILSYRAVHGWPFAAFHLRMPVPDEWIIAAYLFVALRLVLKLALPLCHHRVQWYRSMVSWIQCRSRKAYNPGVRTKIQRSLAPLAQPVRSGHPHASAASDRNAATRGMHHTASILGMRPYVVSPSTREASAVGTRVYQFMNDLQQEAHTDVLCANDCIIMTDVDYYCDMSYWLSFKRPILLYTFVPESAGGVTADGIFSIKDDVVSYTVSGGGSYEHKLWDWNADTLQVAVLGSTNWFAWLLFLLVGRIPYTRVFFNVDQYRVAGDRRIIALTPFATLPDICWGSEEGELKRAVMSHGKHNQFRVLGVEEDGKVISKITVSRAGEPVSCTIPENVFVGACIRYGASTKPHLSDVVRYLGDSDTNSAAVLYSYLSENVPRNPKLTVHTPGEFAKHYQCLEGSKTEDGKQYARRFASPAHSAEAVYPVESLNNDTVCIAERVAGPQKLAFASIEMSSPSTRAVPARYADYADEFTKLLVPRPGAGRPILVSDVDELQSRPTQRNRSALARMLFDEPFQVLSFQKKEAYATPAAPRNISTVPTTHTLRLSSYTLAFKEDVLKPVPWYMPCKTPAQIASAVHGLALRTGSLLEGDYSKFDGSITTWLRQHVEHAAYLRWCSAEHSDELGKLLRDELSPRAKTKFGLSYKPGDSRLSGSPLTTDGNTMINAFTTYAMAREAGWDPAQAYNAGLFYGDDSLMLGELASTSEGMQLATRVAGSLGLNLKLAQRLRNNPAIFLSRVFHDPWTSPSSFQEPMRAMAKINTTVDMNSRIADAGAAKASAYLITDRNTPFVSDWALCYLRCAGRKEMDTIVQSDVPWWVVSAEDRAAPWPQESHNTLLPYVADCLGVRTDELVAHLAALAAYSGDVMSMPTLQVQQAPAKVSSVVDGEIILAAGASSIVIDNAIVQSTPPVPSVEKDVRQDRRQSDRRSRKAPVRDIKPASQHGNSTDQPLRRPRADKPDLRKSKEESNQLHQRGQQAANDSRIGRRNTRDESVRPHVPSRAAKRTDDDSGGARSPANSSRDQGNAADCQRAGVNPAAPRRNRREAHPTVQAGGSDEPDQAARISGGHGGRGSTASAAPVQQQRGRARRTAPAASSGASPTEARPRRASESDIHRPAEPAGLSKSQRRRRQRARRASDGRPCAAGQAGEGAPNAAPAVVPGAGHEDGPHVGPVDSDHTRSAAQPEHQDV
nr:MAG: hypothetical protein [Hubei sediment noda-like virus 5]